MRSEPRTDVHVIERMMMTDDEHRHPVEQSPARAPRRRLLSMDSYGLILLLVVVTYLAAVSFPVRPGHSLVLGFQITTVWLTLRAARAPRLVRLWASTAFIAVATLAVVEGIVVVPGKAVALAFGVSGLLYLIAPIFVVRDIGSRRQVDRETVLGAITGYLLVGMFFAFAYRAIGIIQPLPFFGAAGPGDTAQALFFSFVTLTTTGYGNLVPASNPGQTMAVLEAVVGQLFLVTAVAKVVTAWRPKGWSTAVGPTTQP